MNSIHSFDDIRHVSEREVESDGLETLGYKQEMKRVPLSFLKGRLLLLTTALT
jgi:hypothetical protein